jgi:peptide/nickel transport system permease protein
VEVAVIAERPVDFEHIPGSPELGDARSQRGAGFSVFAENGLAVVGLGLIGFFILFCFVGPLLYHTNQIQTAFTASNQAPNLHHILGTDDAGYDVLGRLMAGGQTTLAVGVSVAIIGTTFGVIYGAVAGYTGGLVDSVMMRAVDAILSIPTLFLLLFLASIFVPSEPLLIVVIASVAWLVPARLIRAETLSLRTRVYVQAAVQMGASRRHIVIRHIIPNSLGTIVVNMTFQVADAILNVAALSFLGLGIAPPNANWGGMLSNGVNFIFDGYWWQVWPAGLCIVALVVSFNLVGDGMRDVVEVRLRQR